MSFFVLAHDIYTCTCNDSLTLSKSLFYIKGVQMTTRKKLCTIKGISEAKMEKIKEAANKLCVRVGISLAFLCWVFTPFYLMYRSPYRPPSLAKGFRTENTWLAKMLTDSGHDFLFRTLAFWLLWSMQTKESRSFA